MVFRAQMPIKRIVCMDYSPLWISFKIAVCATIITFFAGVASAWLVTYLRGAKHVIDAVLSVPLVLPPTVVGFLLLMLLGRSSGVGGLYLRGRVRQLPLP